MGEARELAVRFYERFGAGNMAAAFEAFPRTALL